MVCCAAQIMQLGIARERKCSPRELGKISLTPLDSNSRTPDFDQVVGNLMVIFGSENENYEWSLFPLRDSRATHW